MRTCIVLHTLIFMSVHRRTLTVWQSLVMPVLPIKRRRQQVNSKQEKSFSMANTFEKSIFGLDVQKPTNLPLLFGKIDTWHLYGPQSKKRTRLKIKHMYNPRPYPSKQNPSADAFIACSLAPSRFPRLLTVFGPPREPMFVSCRETQMSVPEHLR